MEPKKGFASVRRKLLVLQRKLLTIFNTKRQMPACTTVKIQSHINSYNTMSDVFRWTWPTFPATSSLKLASLWMWENSQWSDFLLFLTGSCSNDKQEWNIASSQCLTMGCFCICDSAEHLELCFSCMHRAVWFKSDLIYVLGRATGLFRMNCSLDEWKKRERQKH